ncbi:MAG: helix-turn-helix domain-containing protein, partial [Spirochaetota bacterium]
IQEITRNGNRKITPVSSHAPVANGSRGTEILDLKRVGKEAAELAEKEVIEQTLQEMKLNRKAAAKLLKVSYKALLYKIQKYRLDEIKSL